MRHALLDDEALVGRVEENDGAVLVGVVDPGLELVAREHGAGGVVGRAQVDEVDWGFGKRRAEVVCRGGGHVDNVGPTFRALVVEARASGHGVGVDVDGVDRIAYGDAVVDGEDVADVAAVALGAVGDEDLVDGDVHAARREVMLDDGLAQEIVALLGAVAVEGLCMREVVDGGVHGLDDGGCERARHISDAHLDELDVGMGRGKVGRTMGYLAKQVATGEFLVILVDCGHEGSFR